MAWAHKKPVSGLPYWKNSLILVFVGTTFILHLRWCRDILPSLLLCGPGGLSKAESWHAPECTRQSVPQPALFFTKSFLLHHSSPSSSLGGYPYMATRKEGVMPSIWLCTWSIITHLSTAGEPPFHLFTPSSFLCHCLFPPLLTLPPNFSKIVTYLIVPPFIFWGYVTVLKPQDRFLKSYSLTKIYGDPGTQCTKGK